MREKQVSKHRTGQLELKLKDRVLCCLGDVLEGRGASAVSMVRIQTGMANRIEVRVERKEIVVLDV